MYIYIYISVYMCVPGGPIRAPAHEGPQGMAHKRPGAPTRARPTRAQGSPQGPRGAHAQPTRAHGGQIPYARS